jgi:hypothetical protein
LHILKLNTSSSKIISRYALTDLYLIKVTGVLPTLVIWRLYKWQILDVLKSNLRGTYRYVRACARRLNRVAFFYTGRYASQYLSVNLQYSHKRLRLKKILSPRFFLKVPKVSKSRMYAWHKTSLLAFRTENSKGPL